MNAGETMRFDCGDCNAEFEVTYEPKAKGKPSEASGIKPAPEVGHCPFCGADIETEDDE